MSQSYDQTKSTLNTHITAVNNHCLSVCAGWPLSRYHNSLSFPVIC